MSKSILITGTNSGFGKLTAKSLINKGHTVFATMRDIVGRNKENADELKEYVQHHDGKVYLIEMDVTDSVSIASALNQVHEVSNPIDVIVNNAGLGTGGLTEGFTSAQFEKLLAVNVVGVHSVTKAFLPDLRKSEHGQIINISSIMGRIVIPFSSFYTASKYALEGYTESLRYELKPLGIKVSIVEPGGFATGFIDGMQFPEEKEMLDNEYGDYAKVPEEMWSGVGKQVQGNDAPNPQLVADAIVNLIDSNNPELRVIIDPMTGGAGATELNEQTDKIQKALLTGFGMPHLY